MTARTHLNDLLYQSALARRSGLDVDLLPICIERSDDIHGGQYRGHSGNVDDVSVIHSWTDSGKRWCG